MKQRLEYIDAARGLAIFTVVYSHICLFCIPEYHTSSAIIDILRTYFLNGFFFISGMLAYRRDCKFSDLSGLLLKRLSQLLIPTIIVGVIYALTHQVTVKTFFYSDVKCGYWFTISLFEMFTIYYLFIAVVNKIVNTSISTISFTMFCFGIYFAFKSFSISEPINNLLCLGNTAFYIPFFALGVIFSLIKPNVISILRNKSGNALITTSFIVTCLSFYFPVPLLAQRIIVTFMVLWIIHRIYSYPNNNKYIRFGRNILLQIGTNSLEIYFMHYFLLFPLPICVGQYLNHISNSSLSLSMAEFMLVGTFAFVLSFSSILIARILKLIPFVSLLAFGKKTSHQLS